MKAPHITELQAISQNTDSRSFPTSGTTMEYINRELGWGGLGAIITRNSKESEGVWGRVRWNVNRSEGWVSKSLCSLEEVWSSALRPPLTGPDPVEVGRHSSAYSVLNSHVRLPLLVFSSDALTCCLVCCWACRWCSNRALFFTKLCSKPTSFSRAEGSRQKTSLK